MPITAPITKPSNVRIDKACRPGAAEMKVQHQVEHWEVRMHDVARELSAQLDSKMSAWNISFKMPSARSHVLMNGWAASQNVVRSRHAAPDRPASRLTPHISTQAAALTSSPLVRNAATPPASPRPTKERRFDEVYALADAGHAPAVIASRVGSPVGEIELILSLRNRS